MTSDGDKDKVVADAFDRIEITKSNSGEMYQNQLDNMDLALQIEGVENFSRSDWKNNWPKVYSDLTQSHHDQYTNDNNNCIYKAECQYGRLYGR